MSIPMTKISNLTEEATSNFKKLYEIDFNDYVESFPNTEIEFLEWSTAWRLAKEFDSEAKFFIHWSPNHEPYFKTELGYFVYCSVTLKDHIESDVYAFTPKTSEDVATAHQRCLVKCLGRHGLALKLWEKKEREALRVLRNKDNTQENSGKSAAGKERSPHGEDSKAPPRMKSTPASSSSEYRIEGLQVYNTETEKYDLPHRLNGCTLDEAYARLFKGRSDLRDTYKYYAGKDPKYNTRKMKDFLSRAKIYLNSIDAISRTNDEPPPPKDEDIPY